MKSPSIDQWKRVIERWKTKEFYAHPYFDDLIHNTPNMRKIYPFTSEELAGYKLSASAGGKRKLLIREQNKQLKFTNLLRFNFSTNDSKDPKKNISEIIKSQFVSDVPVSLSLSGGYDSNIIYYTMRTSLEKKNYKLYSFYFHDYEKFNEDFKVAEKNCKTFGDYLNPVEVKFQDFQDNIEKIIEILEEPISNQSSILNFYIGFYKDPTIHGFSIEIHKIDIDGITCNIIQKSYVIILQEVLKGRYYHKAIFATSSEYY